MPDPFYIPKRRIARAKRHFADLEIGIHAFLDAEPCTRVVEPHTDGVCEAHKIKSHPIPDGLIDDAVGVAEELRSALDQAGFATAVASGKPDAKSAYFPIADDSVALERDVIGRKRCQDLPPDILTLFRSFKPYKGGNDLVWAVNRVANGTKHRLLVPIGMGTGSWSMPYFKAEGLRELRVPMWDADKDEIVLAIVGPNTHIEYEMQLTFFVAFGPIETQSGKDALAVLGAMIGEIERIVLATEAEARRIGLIT